MITASKRVVIVGQGYVGLPISMAAVKVGHDVVGLDVDDARVQRLRDGDSYVEDIPDEVLRRSLDTGRYLATSSPGDCANFDVAIVTVPTPLSDGAPDLSFIEESANTLAQYVRPGVTVVLESTTYPGTTEELFIPILEDGSGLKAGSEFYVGYSPERIDPGNTEWQLENTPKVVSGMNEASLAEVMAFYDSIVESTVPVSGTREAELTKLLENTYRHVNIALINELAMFAGDLGVNVWESIDAASTKPFGFMRFTPGPGVGGHCLPIDPSYLGWKVKQTLGMPFRFIELANDVNDHMPDYVVRRAAAMLNRHKKAVNGSRILVVGLAYKKNSGDAREAPGPVICELLAMQGADVRAADPFVDLERFPPFLTRVDADESEASAADLVIVITDHDRFDWTMISKFSERVLDTRHRLDPSSKVEYL